MTHHDETADAGADSSRHVYPTQAMTGDYLRAAAGLVPIGVLFATTSIGTVSGVILGSVAAVFGVFGLRTALRHGSSLEMTDAGLRVRGVLRSAIAWTDLDRMKLSYYSTRRDRRSGWMQLELGAGRVKLSLDSRLEGFDRVVRYAATVAAARGLPLSESTVANLDSLGIAGPDEAGR